MNCTVASHAPPKNKTPHSLVWVSHNLTVLYHFHAVLAATPVTAWLEVVV